jgi:hypothetical protein
MTPKHSQVLACRKQMGSTEQLPRRNEESITKNLKAERAYQ